MTLNSLIGLMVLTVKHPAQGLQVLRSFGLTIAQRWMVLALAVSLSAMIAGGIGAAAPDQDGDMLLALFRQPLRLATIQFVTRVFLAAMITWIGRLFGGSGRFEDAILAVAWIELILIAMLLAIIVLSLILPPLALLLVLFLGLLAYGFAFYLILKMIQALHGFTNVFLVLIGFIGAFFVVAFVLSMLGSMFGLLPEISAHDL